MPPIMAPRPNGSTTAVIIPHRVVPSANAPSRSPTGAWPNASRMIEPMIGVIISPTTIPATNVDAE